MQDIIAKYRDCWQERGFSRSVAFGLVFFTLSMVFNHTASLYATEHASNAVKDLLLDNLPVFNVDFIVNEGAAIFGLYIVLLGLLDPKRIPFMLKSAALFILIRSGFIMFTHLGPFPERSFIDPQDIFRTMSFGGDYFFSGHTGMPYLMALIFWGDKRVRSVCLAASVFFGAAVILGHLHYSIDVFAAFFITYTIYVLCKRFFRHDYSRFLSVEHEQDRQASAHAVE